MTDVSLTDRDIVKSSIASFLPMAMAGLAWLCSYCHVPYHHRLAPFTNMKHVYV